MDKWREHIVVGLANVDGQMLVSIVCECTMKGGSLAS
jgi:acetyl-CoA carboxylase beta subunit